MVLYCSAWCVSACACVCVCGRCTVWRIYQIICDTNNRNTDVKNLVETFVFMCVIHTWLHTIRIEHESNVFGTARGEPSCYRIYIIYTQQNEERKKKCTRTKKKSLLLCTCDSSYAILYVLCVVMYNVHSAATTKFVSCLPECLPIEKKKHTHHTHTNKTYTLYAVV